MSQFNMQIKKVVKKEIVNYVFVPSMNSKNSIALWHMLAEEIDDPEI